MTTDVISEYERLLKIPDGHQLEIENCDKDFSQSKRGAECWFLERDQNGNIIFKYQIYWELRSTAKDEFKRSCRKLHPLGYVIEQIELD